MIKPKTKRPWWRKLKRYYLRQYPSRRKLHGGFLHRVLGNRLLDPSLWRPSRDNVAKAVAIGLFIGMLPLMGLQIAISIALCFFWRVNIPPAVVATFITNPITGPAIILLQYRLGLWIAGPIDPDEINRYTGALRFLIGHGKPLMIGSVVSALAFALIGYLSALVIWDIVVKVAPKIPHPHLPHLHLGGSKGKSREPNPQATPGHPPSDTPGGKAPLLPPGPRDFT